MESFLHIQLMRFKRHLICLHPPPLRSDALLQIPLLTCFTQCAKPPSTANGFSSSMERLIDLPFATHQVMPRTTDSQQ